MLSTTKLEYISTMYITKKALWIYSLISQIFHIQLDTTIFFSDNQSIITLATNHQYYSHTKHIDVYYHFIY